MGRGPAAPAPVDHAAVDHGESHVDPLRGAQLDHSGHEALFRRRFWICLALSIPVLIYSPMLQRWLGFAAPALWGVVMTFCSLLPVVGATIVWLPAAIWLLASGDIVRGVVLVAVGVGVIGLVDNVLRPLMLSGRTAASGLVVFLGLVGGVATFGFIGLVLGPIVLVAAMTLLDAAAKPGQDAST